MKIFLQYFRAMCSVRHSLWLAHYFLVSIIFPLWTLENNFASARTLQFHYDRLQHFIAFDVIIQLIVVQFHVVLQPGRTVCISMRSIPYPMPNLHKNPPKARWYNNRHTSVFGVGSVYLFIWNAGLFRELQPKSAQIHQSMIPNRHLGFFLFELIIFLMAFGYFTKYEWDFAPFVIFVPKPFYFSEIKASKEQRLWNIFV